MNSPETKGYAVAASRVLLIEPNLGGHRSIYLAKISAYFAARGEQVCIVTLAGQNLTLPLQKALDEHPAIQLLFHEATAPTTSTGGFLANIRREFAYWKLFRSIFQQVNQHAKVDRVFLPYIDYCLYAIGIKGSPFKNTLFSGICMRPSFHFEACGVIAPKSKQNQIKKLLFRQTLKNRNLEHIYAIDELLVEFIQKEIPCRAEKLRYFPDPAELTGTHTRQSARRALGIPPKEKVVLIYGAIDERKGVKNLLDSIAKTAHDSRPVILLAGQQSKNVREMLKQDVATELRSKRKLIELDKFISEHDEQMCFSAADLVWIAYDNHYTMSGVLIKAVLANLPVISCKAGLIGLLTIKHHLGAIFDRESDFDLLIRSAYFIVNCRDKKFSEQTKRGWPLSLSALK